MAAVAALLLILLCLGGVEPAHARQAAPPAHPQPAGQPPPGPSGAGERPEEAELRERLTEREDETRVEDPWTTHIGGHPLSVAGELETSFAWVEELSFGDPEASFDRLLWEEDLEFEVFYSLGTPLSFFAQFRGVVERDLHSQTADQLAEAYLERGETWIFSEDIAGSGISVDFGRLDFEDDRLWWWDEDLDAVRVEYEAETWDVVVAVAREMMRTRSDRADVDPEQERVVRWIGEASWDWRPDHGLELFALHQNDRSRRHRIGSVVGQSDEDESDATLTWLGLRALGVWQLRSRGIFGYWLDTALVWGRERLLGFEELSGRRSVVESVTRRRVGGWAIDAGVNWILPLPHEPRLFGGVALGSGDREPDSGKDRSFRQTGLHGNESGFGGVQRFGHYGILLDPELSNLTVLTVGTGVSLLRSSSLDLVYHHYRLVEPATSLRDARFDPELDGRHRDLGHGVDVVLALEEWDALELEFSLGLFRAGRAFRADRGDWTVGGFTSLRFAF